MAIIDDFQLSIWREVFDLCRVKAGENIVVLTSEASRGQNIEAAMRTALQFKAKPIRLDVPPLMPSGPTGGERTHVQTTPLTGNRFAVDVLKKADFVLDLVGLMHSPEQSEILAADTRMLLVLESTEYLARMLPTIEDKQRVRAAERRLGIAKSMKVTSQAGTDLSVKLGQFRTLGQYGYSDEPGHWDHWPSGFVATWPNEGSANGRVVIDIGDILLPFKMYVLSAPIVMEVVDGMIVSIEGGFEAKYLRRHIEAYNDPKAYSLSHIGWGLHPKARWGGLGMRDKFQSMAMDARSYYGNMLFSTGPNSEAGGPNNTECHVDIPMADCSVFLDGEPVVLDGDVVTKDMKAVA